MMSKECSSSESAGYLQRGNRSVCHGIPQTEQSFRAQHQKSERPHGLKPFAAGRGEQRLIFLVSTIVKGFAWIRLIGPIVGPVGRKIVRNDCYAPLGAFGDPRNILSSGILLVFVNIIVTRWP